MIETDSHPDTARAVERGVCRRRRQRSQDWRMRIDHVTTHSRHARTRDGDTIERGGGRDIAPELSLLGDSMTDEPSDTDGPEGT
eukprot:42507-Pleurochrysis_carterae.AAC.4